VYIYDRESFCMFVIETRKYRRMIDISKRTPYLKLYDMIVYIETGLIKRKVYAQWIDAKKEKELKDTGKFKEWINSPKQQRFTKNMLRLQGYKVN